MRAHAIAVQHDGFDMPVERDDVGLDADFLVEFACNRLGQGFADFDDAAGQEKRPIIGSRARRPTRTRPARNTATETASIGRWG